jgi:tRNA nucleotidyltransferase (CCA-adding enzyme)
MTALFDRLRALPAAAPLLRRLPERPSVYVVGGAVRDLLLGGAPYDLDLVVVGDAAQVAAALDGATRVHDRFGTSTVVLDGFTYDIATARRESYATPGALPDVIVPASLDEDLTRRDFTVNAIAVALTGPSAGELRSASNALEDLDARRLRILHDRSFVDDPTRMLRLVRYASRLGFSIDPGTRALVDPAALDTVSGARIGTELRLLAREPDPVAALLCLGDLQLDRAIHPDLGLRDPAVAIRALALLPPEGRRDRLMLGATALGIDPTQLTDLLDRLAFEAPDRAAIVAAASRADVLARALASATRPSEIAAAAAGAGLELVAVAGALGPEAQARAWLDDLRHVTLEIDGSDLLAAGVRQGPAVGRGLEAALAAKLDGRTHDRDAELREALRVASAK